MFFGNFVISRSFLAHDSEQGFTSFRVGTGIYPCPRPGCSLPFLLFNYLCREPVFSCSPALRRRRRPWYNPESTLNLLFHPQNMPLTRTCRHFGQNDEKWRRNPFDPNELSKHSKPFPNVHLRRQIRVYINDFQTRKFTRNPVYTCHYITNKQNQMTAPRHQQMDIS
jgi:hypothetical protein